MKQIIRRVIDRKGRVGVVDFPEPHLGPDQVLVQNHYSLISSGTELSTLSKTPAELVRQTLSDPWMRQVVKQTVFATGLSQTARRVWQEMIMPREIGYSGAGRVLSVGESVEGFHVGGKVAYAATGHAEIVAPAINHIVAVPEDVDLRHVSFVTVGGIAIQSLRRAELSFGEVVAVYGLGLVGQICAMIAKAAGCDWRRLEFPAATNRIPRFFRADPDHEGMVKDQQVRRLVKLKKNEKTLTMAAAKAGLSRKTARKYLKSGKLPSQCQPERYWRTRSDPFESVWPEVEEILKRSPTVEGTAVFEYLCRQQEGAFQQGQLRTLQRRIKQWKAEYGEAKEVMFPQKYRPGHQAQSDFTFMGRLGVTIQGQPFPHLLYHFVLAYSNWEATTLCFSESFESLSLGLQNALWELGALPEEHRTDRLSAAVKNLQRDEFTERYQGLLRHLGMRSSHIQAGKAHENGDVEQAHHRLKRAIEQELLLRCSRDFASREEYEGFVAVIVARRNAARQKRLTEELAVMRPLPARRLDDFTRQWVRISPSSTIRVRHNTYSVDSRLIGERVQVRVWADQVEVYYGGRRQARMPRLRGEGKHRIDYRHVIHSLVRKPGAFTRYRWRQDLFPGILFRVAYDELRQDCPATADRQYLKILEVAAQEGEQRVREALQVLIERGQRIRFEALRECLIDPVVEPWEVAVEKMDVGLYDTLLESREVRS